jgi:hypothetical protein
MEHGSFRAKVRGTFKGVLAEPVQVSGGKAGSDLLEGLARVADFGCFVRAALIGLETFGVGADGPLFAIRGGLSA